MLTGVSLVSQVSDTTGPAVVGHTPAPLTNQSISSVRLSFDEPVDPASFTPADVVFTTPSGVMSPANITVTPVGSVLSQYASSVIAFSSQFGTSNWSAAQTLGSPDTNSYGDIPTAWAPSSQNGTTESITVGYSTPVNASGVTVRETDGNGFVTKIEVRDLAGVFHEVWSGVDPSPQNTPADYAVTFPATSYKVDAVRVTIDTNRNVGSWEEIDAIKLDGTVAPAAGGLVTTFDVSFPPQTADGAYTLAVGPNVTDLAGNPMAAAYTAAFTIDRTGPRIASASPTGDVNPPVGTFDVTFASAIEAGSFTTADARLVRPDTSTVTPNSVTRISDTVYRVVFGSQTPPARTLSRSAPRSSTPPATRWTRTPTAPMARRPKTDFRPPSQSAP